MHFSKSTKPEKDPLLQPTFRDEDNSHTAKLFVGLIVFLVLGLAGLWLMSDRCFGNVQCYEKAQEQKRESRSKNLEKKIQRAKESLNGNERSAEK
jgi:hypothetical protein